MVTLQARNTRTGAGLVVQVPSNYEQRVVEAIQAAQVRKILIPPSGKRGHEGGHEGGREVMREGGHEGGREVMPTPLHVICGRRGSG